jgi:hypothetical protein
VPIKINKPPDISKRQRDKSEECLCRNTRLDSENSGISKQVGPPATEDNGPQQSQISGAWASSRSFRKFESLVWNVN